MAKKCIPGFYCIENMTLAIFILLFIVLAYGYYIFITQYTILRSKSGPANLVLSQESSQPIIVVQERERDNIPYARPNVILDPYGPPLKNDYYQRGVAVNIKTRGINSDYTQLGILTRGKGGNDMILPLMGRRIISGLDKWQYYTISNTGQINTKLPIRVKGKSCSGEYGCDCLNDGDFVYVQGYNDSFQATIYENNQFNYIPYI